MGVQQFVEGAEKERVLEAGEAVLVVGLLEQELSLGQVAILM